MDPRIIAVLLPQDYNKADLTAWREQCQYGGQYLTDTKPETQCIGYIPF